MKRTHFKHRLSALGLALLGSTAIGGQAAYAEEPVAKSDEIVVTAQRREQSLTDVPIAISAFNGQALRESGTRNLEDVANLSAGTQIFQNNGTGAPVWVIRGVGIVDFNFNNTPTAAVYLDDVYQVSSVFGSIGLFDIERVEVLKGPQGGLYGRNTSGGAVRVMTRAPDLAKTTGELTASYSRWGRFQADVGASFPLVTDKLAVRLSGRLEQSSSGWQYSLADQRRHGELDAYALRGQIRARPADGVDVRLIVDGGKNRSEIVMPRATGVYAPGGGFCSAVLAGRTDDANCLTYQQLITGSGPSASSQSRGGSRVLADAFGRNNNDTIAATLIADIDLGGAVLTSVSNYRDFNYRQEQESDGIPGEWGHQISGSFFKSYSQELRLRSDVSGPLSWIVGASWARDTLVERRAFPARDNLGFAFLGSPLIFRLNYDQESESWAGFGQLDYDVTDAVTLSAALRYTDESKSYTNGMINVAGNDFFAAPLSADYKLKSHWSGKVSASWKPREDSLLYASVSRGFKVGGFFGGFAFTGTAGISPYKEETVWAYEIGSKNKFADGRIGVNGALFYYDYSDVQGFGTFPDPVVGVTTRLGNVGDAKHYGVELDGFVEPLDGLRLSGSISYLDAKIGNSSIPFSSQGGEVLSYNGFRRLYAPKWSWTAQASYDMSLGSAGTLRFQADANGRSTIIDAAALANGNGVSLIDRAIQKTPGYTLVNGRITYKPASDVWDVSIFGKNLLSERYSTVWGGDGLGSYWRIYGEPVSYGVEFSVRW